jgi:sugar lactone lactonase YvrE
LPFGPVSSDPTLRVRYPRPGRYSAVLTVWDGSGRRRRDGVVLSVTNPPSHVPRQSSTIAVVADHLLAVVSPDSDELMLARWSEAGTLEVERRVPVCHTPRTLCRWGTEIAVACPGDDTVARVDPALGTTTTIALPRGSRPFGVVASDAGPLWVTLQGTGSLAELVRDGGTMRLARTLPALTDARGITLLPDGRIGVTRWRSPDTHAELAVIAPDTAAVETWTLAYDPQAASDTEVGGVPSYLEQWLVSPDGRSSVVPSLRAAIGEGSFVTGGTRPLSFQTTIRAVLSTLDPTTGVEDAGHRMQFDNRGFANAAVFSSRGDYVFVATRGTQTVERVDVLNAQLAGTITEVGFAPNGLALSPDDRFLFVDTYLARRVAMFDVSDFSEAPAPLAHASIPTDEPLSPAELRGKILFNDSHDPRLSRDGYIACAHCHLDGQDDHRVWDFSDRGEGLRNTTSLLGGDGAGALHWTANFDEIQDFEHDLRGPFQGTGLLSDADFHTGTRDQSLGDPKAGLSADLDALAAYVQSLTVRPPSPRRGPDGALPAAALRGRDLFRSDATGCTACHVGEALTDSGFLAPGRPRLHDVGTLGAGSGRRLGGPLTGLDTPTLHGLWNSPPYLHDGSAGTLREVLTTRNPEDRHGRTSHLGAADLDDLEAYLLCLDGRLD